MNSAMIERRIAETAERIYRLQAERAERTRDAASPVGTERDCDIAGERALATDSEYLRALESHFIDTEFLRTVASDRRAA